MATLTTHHRRSNKRGKKNRGLKHRNTRFLPDLPSTHPMILPYYSNGVPPALYGMGYPSVHAAAQPPPAMTYNYSLANHPIMVQQQPHPIVPSYAPPAIGWQAPVAMAPPMNQYYPQVTPIFLASLLQQHQPVYPDQYGHKPAHHPRFLTDHYYRHSDSESTSLSDDFEIDNKTNAIAITTTTAHEQTAAPPTMNHDKTVEHSCDMIVDELLLKSLLKTLTSFNEGNEEYSHSVDEEQRMKEPEKNEVKDKKKGHSCRRVLPSVKPSITKPHELIDATTNGMIDEIILKTLLKILISSK